MANPTSIMLIGEEQVIEDTLKVKFQAQGWRVDIARGGGAALALIRDKNPALIIIEAHLHDMEGYILCQQLKENLQKPHPQRFYFDPLLHYGIKHLLRF